MSSSDYCDHHEGKAKHVVTRYKTVADYKADNPEAGQTCQEHHEGKEGGKDGQKPDAGECKTEGKPGDKPDKPESNDTKPKPPAGEPPKPTPPPAECAPTPPPPTEEVPCAKKARAEVRIQTGLESNLLS